MREGNSMARFTFDNHLLTIENIGDADRAVVEIEIDSQDGDECYASVAIPDTEVPRIAFALLEAAGYGETDDVDEYVNTRPKFSPGDRVYRRLFPHHGHGTVHYVRKDGTPRVLWDAEPANFHDPNLLEKVGEWL